tara:strand:+ start:1192 stop:1500 length:309 start_codon:yes stop_codon:yes gene_type:complete
MSNMPCKIIIFRSNTKALMDEPTMLHQRRIQATTLPVGMTLLPADAPPRAEAAVTCPLHVEKCLMYSGVLFFVTLCASFHKLKDKVPSMAEDRDTSPIVIEI